MLNWACSVSSSFGIVDDSIKSKIAYWFYIQSRPFKWAFLSKYRNARRLFASCNHIGIYFYNNAQHFLEIFKNPAGAMRGFSKKHAKAFKASRFIFGNEDKLDAAV